ncbi:hypothetical protein D3C75_1251870 [compost metagenome]
MDQGIAQLFDDHPVQFGFTALDQKLNVLLQLLGQIPDKPGKTAEQLINRQHSCLHYTFLELLDNTAHVIRHAAYVRKDSGRI